MMLQHLFIMRNIELSDSEGKCTNKKINFKKHFFLNLFDFTNFFVSISIPTCIDYSFDEEDPEGESLLMFGDADGSITVVCTF